jgi:hypothetical protein
VSAPPTHQAAQSAGAAGAAPPAAEADCCPLCRAPLHSDQEWCLRCGAAARTRVAASPRWKAPIIAVAVVAVLALAVLAAALVKLAGDSGSPAAPVAATAPGAASVTSPGTATLPPAASTTPPGASAPAATPPGASTPGAPVAVGPVGLVPVTTLTSTTVTLNGTVNPRRVPTTYQFAYGTTSSYGALAPARPQAVAAGSAAVAASARVANLAPGTTYHYKLIASKAGRAVSTADATFTTLPVRATPGIGGGAPAKTGASR